MEISTSKVTVKLLAAGVQGAEGPCVTLDRRTFFVGPNEGRVIELLAGGRLSDYANTGGMPAGLQLDRSGNLWVSDMVRGIFRILPGGIVEEAVTTFEGKPIRGCNDLIFDLAGNLYFTAPAGSSLEDRCGELFCRRADGEVVRLDDGFAFCNGIALSADASRLFVAETWTKRIFVYDVLAPGVVGPRQLFTTLPGDHWGGPDGMDFAGDGRLVIAHWGASTLDIVSPSGDLVDRLHLPFAAPSNVHFAGPDSTELLITEHTNHGLWICDFGATGQTQYGWS